MPIDFQPPSTQPFQITPTQYTDPLQTLAQMGQLRTQGLQQQTAQLGLEQERQSLDSAKAMMQVMAETKPGETFQQTIARATATGKILPAHLKQYGDATLEWQKGLDLLDENKRKKMAAGISTVRPLYEGVTDQTSLDAANQAAVERGVPPQLLFKEPYTDPTHLTAHVKSLIPVEQAIKESQEKAATAASLATEAKEKVQTTEAEQKVGLGENAAVIRELQRAPVDPKTLTPIPSAVAEIQARHKNVILPPDISTKAGFDRFVRSGVPTEKQPEYDLAQRINELGMFGKDQWDQFLYQNAKTFQNPDGTPKAPGQVTPQEYNTIKQKWAEYTADPVIRAIAIGQKGGQQKLVEAQVASLPSPEEIQNLGKDLVNLDISPSQYTMFKTARVNEWPQVVAAARKYAASIGKPFSLANLDDKFRVWENTEKEYATGKESDQIQSFENLMNHYGLLWKAKDALAKSDLPALRSIAGALRVAGGGTKETVFQNIVNFVADEESKTFVPGGGGIEERAERRAKYAPGKGAQQIADNITTSMHLVDSQRSTLERKYREGTFGKGSRIGSLFSQEALDARDQILGRKPAAAPRTGRIVVKAGDNSLHPFDTEAQAKAFEDAVKAAGGTTTRQ